MHHFMRVLFYFKQEHVGPSTMGNGFGRMIKVYSMVSIVVCD